MQTQASISTPVLNAVQSQAPFLTPAELKAKKLQRAKVRHERKLASAREILHVSLSAAAAALLRIEDLEIILKRSRSSINRDIAAGRFPPPLKLGKRCSRWAGSTVEMYLTSLRA